MHIKWKIWNTPPTHNITQCITLFLYTIPYFLYIYLLTYIYERRKRTIPVPIYLHDDDEYNKIPYFFTMGWQFCKEGNIWDWLNLRHFIGISLEAHWIFFSSFFRRSLSLSLLLQRGPLVGINLQMFVWFHLYEEEW